MKIRQRSIVLLLVLSFFALAPSSLLSQSLTTEAFFRFNDFDGIKISPDGVHVAMAVPKENLGSLIIMDIETNSIVAQFDTRINQKMGEFYWANNERILFSTVITIGGLDAPLLSGEIYALNIDNTRKLRLVGPAAGDIAGYGISNMLMDDEEHVRVVRLQIRRGRTGRSRPTSYLLDIYDQPVSLTGRTQASLRRAVRSPLPWGNLHSDRAGIVRVATAVSEEFIPQIQYRADDDAQWIDISDDFTAEARRARRISWGFVDRGWMWMNGDALARLSLAWEAQVKKCLASDWTGATDGVRVGMLRGIGCFRGRAWGLGRREICSCDTILASLALSDVRIAGQWN